MTQRSTWAMSMVVAGLMAFGSAQAATNLVTNGGFETGTFAGWTGTGDTTFNGVQCPGADASVYEGNCSAFFGPFDAAGGGISQVINVGGAGQYWDLSFAFQADGANPSGFSVTFGGQTLLSLTNPPAGANTLYHFSGVTTGDNMALAFNFIDPVGYLFLDAVSVSAIPEPTTTALLGAGLAAMVFWRRRKTA
jgi:PEP-CTERM motif